MEYVIEHHGIKGQKWGVRRFQNADGSLTAAGKKRYSRDIEKYRDSEGNLTSAGKMRYREDGTKLTLKNMTDEEYEYAMRQMQREKEFKDMQRSAGINTSFQATDLQKAAIALVGACAAMTLTEALSDNGITDGKKLAKKLLLTAGLTTISTLTKAAGADNVSVQKISTNSGFSNANSSTNPLLVKTRNLQGELGNPKGIYGAEDEKAYANLFQRNPTDDQRAMIKALRKNGYGVDQIEQYVFHSGLTIRECIAFGFII